MKRVLVVDDDEDVRLIVTNALSTSGFEVKTASDGHQALASAAASVPDVIVLDVMMPEVDGLEVCRQLGGDGTDGGIPIILLTARSTENDVAKVGPASERRWIYAISKLAAEHFAHAYGDDFGLKVVTVRPFNVYGPRQVGEVSVAVSVFCDRSTSAGAAFGCAADAVCALPSFSPRNS